MANPLKGQKRAIVLANLAVLLLKHSDLNLMGGNAAAAVEKADEFLKAAEDKVAKEYGEYR